MSGTRQQLQIIYANLADLVAGAFIDDSGSNNIKYNYAPNN